MSDSISGLKLINEILLAVENEYNLTFLEPSIDCTHSTLIILMETNLKIYENDLSLLLKTKHSDLKTQKEIQKTQEAIAVARNALKTLGKQSAK